MSKWTSDDDKYVLYMDIMGFKERVRSTDFSVLQEQFNELCSKLKNRISPLTTGEHLVYYQFSDSIVLTTDEATPKGLNLMIRAGATIMQESMKVKFPINGAIAKGKFSCDTEKNIFFGQALVDAYLLQSTLFYYGLAVHPNVDVDIKKFMSRPNEQYKKTSKLLFSMPIPLKGGSASYYNVNWNLLGANNDIKDTTREAQRLLNDLEKGTTIGNPRIYIENTRQIIDNVKSIFDELLQN
jgi:hypothetical protein